MNVPHPIPYQGSKRRLTTSILGCFPSGNVRLIEPFAGSAAVTLAAAAQERCSSFVVADLNAPLVGLWRSIVERPEELCAKYEQLWHDQTGRERRFYDEVRDSFNRDPRPEYLLYLLLRCVKAAVRYNSSGHFNQSPDNRRRGMRPDTLRDEVVGASHILRRRTEFKSADYREVLSDAGSLDIIYMDPPYQGVSGDRDGRYISGVPFDQFASALDHFNRRGLSYILSYDGRANDKVYGRPLPADLDLFRIEIEAGRSTQATFLGRDVTTFESLYLSPALARRIGRAGAAQLTRRAEQTTLFSEPSVTEWASPASLQNC